MATTKPRREPRRRDSTAIVDAILDAAEQLLVEHDLHSLTTNAIAKRAGVSVGSVYQYFPNKQAIVAGMTGRLNDRLDRTIGAAINGSGTPRERVLAAIFAYCDFGDEPLRRAILVDVPRSWDEAGIDRTEESVRDLITDLVPSFPSLDPDEAFERLVTIAFATRGAVQGALLMHHDMTRLRARLQAMVEACLPDGASA